MLFGKPQWPGLADGSIRVAFRRWKRPTVTAGGTLQTPAGLLAIDTVDAIAPEQITDADAVLAGFADRAAVLAALPSGPGRTLYRIAFHHAGADPRVLLREDADLDPDGVAAITVLLDRLDARGRDGPWTLELLRLVAAHPATRAADLAARIGDDTPRLKRRVRRLGALGLTESLDVGYRLSPRGRALLERLG